jgi:hypothetical protein
MSDSENTELLKVIQRLLVLLADRENDVQKFLIDVQAVIAVTESIHQEKYLAERESRRKTLKYGVASDLELSLRQVAQHIELIAGSE